MSYFYDDNPIVVDVNSRRNRKQKILCVLCKIELNCISPEENRYKCPSCKNTYQLGFEINEFEDSLESSHEDEDDIELSGIESDSAGIGLLTSDNEDGFTTDEDDEYDNKSGSIPIPDYMKSSGTRTIVEYREE
jgi:CRISPR/Cas system-associated protein Cas10 (large subunit of type III CRISPR-Cas system)